VKTFLNGTIPALTNIKVGSLCGISGADEGLRHLRARAGAGATAQAGKSYELWALPDNGSAPVSLGVIPAVGEIDRELTDAQRAALRGASKVAVSLEPEGGSATGAPTGPVLFVAERVKRA
jgi:anti-sigma-K factor RskA